MFIGLLKTLHPRKRWRRWRAQRLYSKYQQSTMIPRDIFVGNLLTIQYRLDNPTLAHGALIECGTFKGGMSAAMMEIGGNDRPYLFFDSFRGLPTTQEVDGPAARAWEEAAAIDPENYNDACVASLGEFKQTLEKATRGRSYDIYIGCGWFKDAFAVIPRNPKIAVLRLDADWYESTMQCLDQFWDHIIPGGMILIDDYYMWDGCSRAVHDFLAKRKASERIEQGEGFVAFITKRS